MPSIMEEEDFTLLYESPLLSSYSLTIFLIQLYHYFYQINISYVCYDYKFY